MLIFFEIDALPHMRAPRLFEIDAVPNIQDPRDMCFWTLAFFSSIGGLPPTTTTLFSKPFPHTFAHSFHFLHNQSQSRTVVHCDHAFGVHAAFRTQERHQAATTPQEALRPCQRIKRCTDIASMCRPQLYGAMPNSHNEAEATAVGNVFFNNTLI